MLPATAHAIVPGDHESAPPLRQPEPIAYSAYLAAEAASPVKHEYLAGRTWAMAGGTPEHAAICANLITALSLALRGKPCRVFTSDMRLRIPDCRMATYPDVTVICGPAEPAADDRHAAVNPVLLVEVLSDSSEAYDRGEKAAMYRRIPSLQEYLLVAQTSARVERYRRCPGEVWELAEAGPSGTIELSSIAVTLDVSGIYYDPLAHA